MNSFDSAQKYFGKYEQGGSFINLNKAIELLDEIISSKNEDSERAQNLKNRIKIHIATEIRKLSEKYNLPEYNKKDSKTSLEIFENALSTTEKEKFFHLIDLLIEILLAQ